MNFKIVVPVFILLFAGCATVPQSSVDKEGIRRAIHFRLRDFRYCFEENYSGKAGAEGKYILEGTYDKESIKSVAPVKESQTLPPSRLFDDCMIGVIKEIQFPVPTEGDEVTARYPFYFRQVQAPPPKPAEQQAPSDTAPAATPEKKAETKN